MLEALLIQTTILLPTQPLFGTASAMLLSTLSQSL